MFIYIYIYVCICLYIYSPFNPLYIREPISLKSPMYKRAYILGLYSLSERLGGSCARGRDHTKICIYIHKERERERERERDDNHPEVDR